MRLACTCAHWLPLGLVMSALSAYGRPAIKDASEASRPLFVRALNASSNGTVSTNAVGKTLGTSVKGQPPQTRYFNFTITEAYGSPDGYSKRMIVANGQFPGPLLEANEYDRIVVNVTNGLANATAIHWHGLYQYRTPYYDGTTGITQCGIPPGQSLVYNYTFDGPSNKSWSGTTWWHSHFSTTLTDGFFGALIVHPANETISLPYDDEVVIQLADNYHTFSLDLLAQYLSPYGIQGVGMEGEAGGNEPVPDSGTINGVGQWGPGTPSYWSVSLQPNKTYRLRLINTGSFASTSFSVDYHNLTVVEVDGTIVEPYTVSSVDLAVAQRYSVLLTTNKQADAYWIRSTIDQDMFTYNVDGANYNQLAVMRYGVSQTAMPKLASNDSDPGTGSNTTQPMDTSLLVPASTANAPDATYTSYVSFSQQNTPGNYFRAFFNNTSWEPLSGTTSMFSGLGNTTTGLANYGDQFVLSTQTAQVLDLVVNNFDDGDHPFHLHGHRFWIVGNGAGLYAGQAMNGTRPMQRDTLVIPAYTWVALRFVTNNPGYWAFHCHIVWHMASGLLMQIASLDGIKSISPPPTMLQQCQYKYNTTLAG